MHGLGTLGRIRSGPASLPLAKLGSQPILAQRPLAEWKAGPWTAPRRGVRVLAPEEKQGVRADRDDDVRADGVARLAGGDKRVSSPAGCSGPLVPGGQADAVGRGRCALLVSMHRDGDP